MICSFWPASYGRSGCLQRRGLRASEWMRPQAGHESKWMQVQPGRGSWQRPLLMLLGMTEIYKIEDLLDACRMEVFAFSTEELESAVLSEDCEGSGYPYADRFRNHNVSLAFRACRSAASSYMRQSSTESTSIGPGNDTDRPSFTGNESGAARGLQ
eukprot:scaffold100030_cov22-Tisochrysis_lutea.AAC.1